MILDWIWGVLIRPGDTFERSKTELRFGYWWILLYGFTLEIVVSIYAPFNRDGDPTDAALLTILFLLVLLDLQAVCLLIAGRLFGWIITWRDALKYVGLSWSVIVLEDIVMFYPTMKEQRQVLVWMDLVFSLLYLVILAAGVRRLTRFTHGRTIGITLAATLPWLVILAWMNYLA